MSPSLTVTRFSPAAAIINAFVHHDIASEHCDSQIFLVNVPTISIIQHFHPIFHFWFRLQKDCHVLLCRLCRRDQPALHHRHPRHRLLLLPLLNTGFNLSQLVEQNQLISVALHMYAQEAKNPVFEFITLVTLVFSLVSIYFRWQDCVQLQFLSVNTMVILMCSGQPCVWIHSSVSDAHFRGGQIDKQ